MVRQMEFPRSETIVAGPEIAFFFDGKDLARSHGKTCLELEGLGFERNVDPRTSPQKTAKIKTGVVLQSKRSHLLRVDEPMEQRAGSNRVIENDDVNVGHGSEMHEIGKMPATHGNGFGIKRWRRDARGVESDGFHGVEQGFREMILHAGLPNGRKRPAFTVILRSFLPKIRDNLGDHFRNTRFRQLESIHGVRLSSRTHREAISPSV